MPPVEYQSPYPVSWDTSLPLSMVQGFYPWLNNTWLQVREMMARNPELWSLFFALVLSGIVSHLDNPSGSGAPFAAALPPRILSRDSPVAEFPTGDLGAVRQLIASTQAEVWIIMYYAHWDAYSLETAKEFEETAHQFSGQVLFMAVNCWYPQGACRHKVTVPHYPILFAHRDSRDGIQYTGLHQAQELVQFVKQVCTPVRLVTDAESLTLLRAQHDTVALAYFSYEHTHTPPGLASYQWAAVLHLQKDPIQPTLFAIVTSKQLAASVGLNHSKNFTLLRTFNVSLNYPPTEVFKAKPIVAWVNVHRESLVQWIAPPGMKSTMLSSQVFQHPSIILFTPHRYNSVFDNNFMLMREVAMQYYNCYNNSYINKLIKVTQDERTMTAGYPDNTHCSEREQCSNIQANENDCCQTLATRGRLESITTAKGNVCEVCETFDHPLDVSSDPCSYLTAGSGMPFPLGVMSSVTASSNACLYVNNFYSPYSHYRLCCQDVDLCHCNPCSPLRSSHTHSHLRGSLVHESRTFSHLASMKCQNYKCREHSKYFPDKGEESWNNIDKSSRTRNPHGASNIDKVFESLHRDFEGLICKTNRTLDFRVMRSEYTWPMAERLGLKPALDQEEASSVGIAIVDIQNETHHILQLDESSLTPSLLKQFIINYTQSILPRHTHSTLPSTGHRGIFRQDCREGTDRACITEVTSQTYDDIVLDNTKDVLLLYYAPWCGACLRIQHLYLQLALLFQSHRSVTISRINADTNDLPWHLSSPAFPTILFFPGGNKAKSIRFPLERAITLPHLVEFVLQHSR